MAKAVGVPTPIIDSVIQWATAVYDYDFYGQGRNEHMLDLNQLIQDVRLQTGGT